MPNEVLFFLHALICFAGTFAAWRLGKEALVVWVALQAVIANLFILKQIEFFSLTITCCDVYIIGSILALNLLQEYFGKEAAKKATVVTFFAMVFFSIVAFLHMNYTPSVHDTAQTHYAAILTVMPKLTIISILVFFVSQRLDIFAFSLLNKKIPLAIRSGLSMSVSQALDTGLFTYFALRDLVEDPIAVFGVSYIIKMIVILICIAPLKLFNLKSSTPLPKAEQG